jgi:hypothetical protein
MTVGTPPQFSDESVRAAVWRLAHRDDLNALIQSSRALPHVRLAQLTTRLLSAVELGIRQGRTAGVPPQSDRWGRLVDAWAGGEALAALSVGLARTLEPGKPGEDAAPTCSPADVVGGRVAVLAARLWGASAGGGMLREAMSLTGLPQTDAGHEELFADLQLDESERQQLYASMADDVFVGQLPLWIDGTRTIASERPGTGGCTLATAMQLWNWTLRHLQRQDHDEGEDRLRRPSLQGAGFELASALGWLLAARQQIVGVMELDRRGPSSPAPGLPAPALVPPLSALCHVLSARAAGEVGRICADLVFGIRRHPAWDAQGRAACYVADELDGVDDVIPGMASTAPFYSDVLGADGAHPTKAGPCVPTAGLEPFLRLRARLDGCLSGSRIARDSVAAALTTIAIPDGAGLPPSATSRSGL